MTFLQRKYLAFWLGYPAGSEYDSDADTTVRSASGSASGCGGAGWGCVIVLWDRGGGGDGGGGGLCSLMVLGRSCLLFVCWRCVVYRMLCMVFRR